MSLISVESVSGNIHEVSPVFLDHSDLVAYVYGSSVVVLSVVTTTKTTTFLGHGSSAVTGLVYDSQTRMVMSVSLDGRLCEWSPFDVNPSHETVWSHRVKGVDVLDLLLVPLQQLQVFLVTQRDEENNKDKSKDKHFLVQSLHRRTGKISTVCAVQTGLVCCCEK